LGCSRQPSDSEIAATIETDHGRLIKIINLEIKRAYCKSTMLGLEREPFEYYVAAYVAEVEWRDAVTYRSPSGGTSCPSMSYFLSTRTTPMVARKTEKPLSPFADAFAAGLGLQPPRDYRAGERATISGAFYYQKTVTGWKWLR
jgi:hypothetical protein